MPVDTLDWTVIRTAATAGLLVIVPGAFVASVLFDDGPTGLAWLFLLVVLAGLGLSGYVAGRLRSDTPIAHGLISGLLCYLVAQLFGVIVSLARGDTISWALIPLGALLACLLATGGALLSDVVHRRAVRTG